MVYFFGQANNHISNDSLGFSDQGEVGTRMVSDGTEGPPRVTILTTESILLFLQVLMGH